LLSNQLSTNSDDSFSLPPLFICQWHKKRFKRQVGVLENP